MSFKALLYLRKGSVHTKHSLTPLFELFDENDKVILREYFADYQAIIGGNTGAFPLKSLDDFLLNLDGDKNPQGDHFGLIDWRYFPIEEKRSQEMPLVSVDYLHEIVFGCTRIVEHAHTVSFEPSRYTYSWRMRSERMRKYSNWNRVRMNSVGWGDLGDRLEILWGPDYHGRHDLYLIRGKKSNYSFSEIPEEFALPIFDKRKEIEDFDAEGGLRSTGITRILRPSTN